MSHIITILQAGGITIYPLIILAIIATALIVDKILLYKKLAILPPALLDLIETFGFSWHELENQLMQLNENNFYRHFFVVILNHHKKPAWWVESRAGDEATLIEAKLKQGLWALETITTAAPLMGLFGTIIGMMNAFKLIGGDGVVNPTGVTSGVAEALIATALGLLIAIVTLFAFNYFSGRIDKTLDELERLGTRVIDHIKLDEKN